MFLGAGAIISTYLHCQLCWRFTSLINAHTLTKLFFAKAEILSSTNSTLYYHTSMQQSLSLKTSREKLLIVKASTSVKLAGLAK